MTFRIDTLYAAARDYQWERALNSEYGEPVENMGWRSVAPEMNAADLDDYDTNWRQSVLDSAKADGTYDASVTLEGESDDLFDKAEDHYLEFDAARDHHYAAHDPVMNFYWPLGGGRHDFNEAATARAVSDARCCVLVEVDGEFGIALTGGGMDLSDRICRAYMNVGCVPPLALLTSSPWAWRAMTGEEKWTVAARVVAGLDRDRERVLAYAAPEVDV